MDCITFMVRHLAGVGFEFTDPDVAHDQIKETCKGNADDLTEPFDDKNYEGWAARLAAEHGWTVTGEEIREAREAWLDEHRRDEKRGLFGDRS